MDADLGYDSGTSNEESEDLLFYGQDGPGLFDEPLPTPETACDIAATNQDLPGEPDQPEDEDLFENGDLPDDLDLFEPDGEFDEQDPDELDGPAEQFAPPIPSADQLTEPEPPASSDSESGQKGQKDSDPADGSAGSCLPDAAEQSDQRASDPMPLALYRRYRPDTFSQVIGQDHVTEPLCRAISNNKVNHAYLFSGPRGCGKTTSARILARCLNCEQGPTATPCGVCDSCIQLATGGPGSIDVIEIDAASHGKVDDARELRDGVYFSPVSARYKIYIIDEAHMVTKEGFNALLKVVEEPPEHVKFIFATTEPEKVIGTVRSRTHHYHFRLVPPRILSGYLEKICAEESVEIERGVLPLVVRAGAGSVRDSLSVLDQLLGAADHGKVRYAAAAGLLGYTPDALLDEVVDAFAAGDGKGVFQAIDKVIEIGQDPRRFAEDLLGRMRDLVIVAQVPDAIESGLIDASEDQAERLRVQASSLGAGELTRAAEVIGLGLTQMRGTTAPRLHLEVMCARILLPTADDDDKGVHARLDRLERRLDMPDLAPGRRVPQSALEASPSEHQERRQIPASSPNSPRESDTGANMSSPVAQRPAQQRPVGAQVRLDPMPPDTGQRPAPVPNIAEGTESSRIESRNPEAEQRFDGERMTAGQNQRVAPPKGQDGFSSAQNQPRQGQSAPLRPSEPAESSQGASTADLRRLWPQVLDEVKSRKRFAHMLLSQNAHVVEVLNGQLMLGFVSPGSLENFRSGESIEVLRQSLIKVVGADLRISASLDGGPSLTDQVGARSQMQNAPAFGSDQVPMRENRSSSESASYSVSAPSVDPEMPPDNSSDMVAGDDVVLDESGEDAVELLKRELGATIIESGEN